MLASSRKIRHFESQNLILKYFNQKNILLKITPLKVKFSLLKVKFEKKFIKQKLAQIL